ncbi:hypothetical protein [Flavobacterium pygoscelis]|uniref:hypothetical protein n=1 Tax=Flavobacterium pygoscelis TaxID=2893176 RepID=UPI0020C02D66|nr:hypothetical protein [Flavobacterium pygoscelis]
MLFLSSFIGYTQKNDVQVIITGRAQKDKVLLRWDINSPVEWQKANKKGYLITSTTLIKDGNIIKKPEKVVLTPKPLVPDDLDSWIGYVQKDNNAAIVAQSIYGESFEVSVAKEGDLSRIVNRADELNQRY